MLTLNSIILFTLTSLFHSLCSFLHVIVYALSGQKAKTINYHNFILFALATNLKTKKRDWEESRLYKEIGENMPALPQLHVIVLVMSCLALMASSALPWFTLYILSFVPVFYHRTFFETFVCFFVWFKYETLF